MVRSIHQIIKLCKKINIVITDVDGVLTDGGMYYSDKGELLKKFNTRDGMGFELLRKAKIKTIIITREKSKMVKERGKKIKANNVFLGILRKEELLEEICKKNKVLPENIAYIGDDVNDVKLLEKVGLAAMPNDGIKQLRTICDYRCKACGGKGVLRETADLMLNTKFSNKYKSY